MFTSAIEKILSPAAGSFSIGIDVFGTDIVFRHNPIPYRSASMIKPFMMVEAFRQAREGLLDFSASVTLTPEVKTYGAGSLYKAPDGTRVTIGQLNELMITESDNTATNIMIDLLGTANINRMIQDLGCPGTSLQRKMMDWESARAGRENWTTVQDCNRLWSLLHRQECLDPVSDAAMLEILCKQTDKGKLPLFLPSSIRLAHKTGELKGAEHDGGIVYARRPYALTILSDQLPDAEQGKLVIAKLSRTIYDILQLQL